MPQTLVFLHRLRYVLSVPLSLTNSPIYSIFLLGDSNIQTLVFLHHLSIFLLDTGGLSRVYTKNTYNYHHSPIWRSLILRLGGRSLFWVEGEKDHKRMRGLIAPAFSSDNVREMHTDIYHVATALQTRITNEIHASGESSLQLNILDYTARATMDIIGRVAWSRLQCRR